MNNNEYVRLSLELHLFFARIMKEHSLFLETAFMERDNDLKQVARQFEKSFSDILRDVVVLANGNIGRNLLSSGEIVTPKTLEAERRTSDLSGRAIDVDITRRELNLKSGSGNISENMVNSISSINRQTLPIIEDLIKFKDHILNSVLTCRMYTTNYPLLISHIMNEAKMYYNLLSKVENRKKVTRNELYEQEVFWNNIMKEHAEFIRGLLDPSERELLLMADKYAQEYTMIMKNHGNNPSNLTDASLKETISFRDFKVASEEGILNCQVKSIIIPLLADHIVREANHFIRILESIKG